MKESSAELADLRRQHRIITWDNARKLLFKRALVASNYNQHLTARLLDIDQKTVWRWVKELS